MASEPPDGPPRVGVCSTRPSATADTPRVGVDTLKLLFETHTYVPERTQLLGLDGWAVGSIPALGLSWAEGHPAGAGELASSEQVQAAAELVREVVDTHLGVRAVRGVSRSDQTVTTAFDRPAEARAFLAGMAAVDLPRMETTRRGHPVHSISWSAPNGARKLARVYDKGLELGGEAFRSVRLEDQRRYPSGKRPMVEALDGEFLRGRFEARFGAVRKAVDGVKAASFPVVAQAIADEVKAGERDWRSAERLAGALVLTTGGAGRGSSVARRTYYRRRAELRSAGYVVVDDLAESVEVELGDVVEAALAATW